MFHPTALLFLVPLAAPLQEPGGVSAKALQKKVDEISPRVAQLRGWDFKKRVPAGVQTPDQFLEFARKEFEEEYGLEKFQAMGRSYRLLGLVPPEIDLLDTYMELLREQVGGYYDPKTETFYMISTFNEGALADVIMSHELTHALDDQYYQLDDLFEAAKGNSDREFAIRAVVEGSGTSLMGLYVMQATQKGWLDMADLLRSQMKLMEEQAASLEKAPPYLVLTLALPYLEGNKFLARNPNMAMASLARPSDEDLKHAFEHPPVSSEQVLHFDKYWNAEDRDEPTPVKLPDLSARLGAGWNLADADTLGELGVFVITAEELPDLLDANSLAGAVFTNGAAVGWDGDLYQLYQGPDGAEVVVWATVWDSEADRGEFVAAMMDVPYNSNAFFQSVEGDDDWALVYFAGKQGKSHLEDLKQAVRAARPDWRVQ